MKGKSFWMGSVDSDWMVMGKVGASLTRAGPTGGV